MSSDYCLKESQIKHRLTRFPLQNPNEYITAPDDAMQIGLVPGLPPFGGYENIVTAMDVFSRYLFAYPTSNQEATTTAKVIFNILTKHAYLPTTLISDKGTAFTSHVTKEVAGVLGIKARRHKARSNNWATWAISRVNQTVIEDWNKRAEIIVA